MKHTTHMEPIESRSKLEVIMSESESESERSPSASDMVGIFDVL